MRTLKRRHIARNNTVCVLFNEVHPISFNLLYIVPAYKNVFCIFYLDALDKVLSCYQTFQGQQILFYVFYLTSK